ncbi:PKD domain-containing protein [Modestobacter muralis]|uniref:PKD domain-containing protein n=1 Tax=Modestobacter muralis TaxID=1608614 RepID=A0A6P0H7F4_9ACTN|nr:PKD domain-containing protein [Modestobacter muralis]NEK94849.1 PKD domain-containing protein [Modestobacter muralis]NEN51737.1 PKD domain-containing protein [Modestobacter muralis]
MSSPTARTTQRVVAGLLSPLLLAGAMTLLLPGTARADSAPLDATNTATPRTVTADALPTVQIDGVAWSQVVVGDTVYVAGKFGFARPAGAAVGTQQTVRNNMLAYDVRTGALITSFAPDLNGTALVVTASPDGSRVYVGGDFTRANGQVRNRVAAYSTSTGALLPDFKPSVSGQVRAIAATDTTVYLGGGINAVGSTSRSRLAAVSASNGALLPWAPVPGVGDTKGNRLPVFDAKGNPTGTLDTAANARTSSDVLSLVVTGGGRQVVAAGRFATLNGVEATGVGALDATTGATRPFAINQLLTNQGINSAVYSLSTDGTNVYGTGYDYYGPGNLEGAFAADALTGAVRWVADSRGDTYNSFAAGGAVYLAAHTHAAANFGGFPQQDPQVFRYASALSAAAAGTNHRYADLRGNTALVGTPAPAAQIWDPSFAAGAVTGQEQAGWSVTGNGRYVVYGGEFPRVNGVEQHGLVRFAVPGTAPAKMGPTGKGLTPTVTSLTPGTARVSWTESTDQDNENLTYRVYRDGGTTPVYEVTSPSQWWSTDLLAFQDSGLSAGTHTYRVGVVDPSGNKNTGPTVSVTVAAGSTPARSYTSLVRADGASGAWSLGESSGTVARDRAGANDLTLNAGVSLRQGGALAQDTDTAASFSGTTTGFAATTTKAYGPQTFSVEAWVNTTTKAGGKIIGWGTSATGTSGNYDRHVYMDTSGRLLFGTYTGATDSVTSPRAYNDGRWHHVVATLGAAGQQLYVDGALVASRADATTAEPNYGYWRIGGDSSWSGSPWFAGKIDEVAVYPTALTAAQVAGHHRAGTTGTVPNLPPTASTTSSVTDLTAAFDGSASRDADGSLTSWAWTFGDGTTGTGRTTSHAYKAAGTYAVTLTVTDDKGATAVQRTSVTVTAPPANVAPTAVVTAAAAGRTGTFDASGSTDTDGEVARFEWDFGDGTTGTGARATHEYAADGTYAVTLTVTDDDGATGTARTSLVVNSTVLASDAFGRTVTGGLGTADRGGAWTAAAGATRQSVKPVAAALALTAGTNTGSYLGAVSQTSVDLRTTLTLSARPTGTGASVYLTGRRVGANQEQRARLRFLADGSVRVAVTELAGTTTESLVGAEATVPGLTYTAGTPLQVAVQVTGTGPTTLSATVWPAGTAQPATPTVTRTSTTASLQAAGSIGVSGYLAGSATAPVTVTVGTLTAAPAGATPAPAPAPAPAPVNAKPTAVATSSTADLTATLDGSGSTDTDGTVTAWSWAFGDGASADGATVTHTYAAAGTYPVTLTVTDDDGATASVVRQVPVTAPAAPAPEPEPTPPGAPAAVASDAFGRTVTGGLGTADLGGAWTATAGAARQSVTPGQAVFGLTPGTNTGSVLTAVSRTDADVRTRFSSTTTPGGTGTSVYVVGRRVAANQEYRARVRLLADGSIGVGVTRLAGTGTETLLGADVVLPGRYTSGQELAVRFTVRGTGTTDLAVTVWPAGSPEPTTPTVARTDTTASLQAAGSVGLLGYLSGSATGPATLRFGDLTVRPVA